MVQTLAKVLGWVFVVVGVLGFVPVVTSNGSLLGLFDVDATHNVVHLLSGIVALLMARSEGNARLYMKIFGVVYALVTIVGFVQGDTVLNLFVVNGADNVLHLVIAAVALYAGFGMRSAAPAGMGSAM